MKRTSHCFGQQTEVHQMQTSSSNSKSKRTARTLPEDNALIELVHLHDCLRGALESLEADVEALSQTIRADCVVIGEKEADLERRVSARFNVIRSVYSSHSSVEDKYIWPALILKGSSINLSTRLEGGQDDDSTNGFQAFEDALTRLRAIMAMIVPMNRRQLTLTDHHLCLPGIATELCQQVKLLKRYLTTHLSEEEATYVTVAEHLSKIEAHELVSKIMGKRSADTNAEIMKSALRNLELAERAKLIDCMKVSMEGTFFDRWLNMSGWMAVGETDNVPTPTGCGSDNRGDPSCASSTTIHSFLTRRKSQLVDAAFVEITKLHDCLRGALTSLEKDANDLAFVVKAGTVNNSQIRCLSRQLAARFHVIWSVFRAHSSAEDEFIFPALKKASGGQVSRSDAGEGGSQLEATEVFEDDHIELLRHFSEMDCELSNLQRHLRADESPMPADLVCAVREIREQAKNLSSMVFEHLDHEEAECLPMVAKYLSSSEVHELVGKIMGKRSAQTVTEILSMAVQNLDERDRDAMICSMEQAMSGTYFDGWLRMSGWSTLVIRSSANGADASGTKRLLPPSDTPRAKKAAASLAGQRTHAATSESKMQFRSQEELNATIRRTARRASLTLVQKNAKIQELRKAFWYQTGREGRLKNQSDSSLAASKSGQERQEIQSHATANSRLKALLPAAYFKGEKESNAEAVRVWPSNGTGVVVPVFSEVELKPTYHIDDKTGAKVLGCPHYARKCKLRHPESGRLYTCRLCGCQQLQGNGSTERGMPQDTSFDRYAVKEILCMTCTTLQPASNRCCNPSCKSDGTPFAKYNCRICNLYDDSGRPIFHCPYCNTCRLGLGLGIGFRHCMRCNACVRIGEEHQCLPQKLQGDCPICHERLFESTEPLRGLKCGHAMHMSCYQRYKAANQQCYTCPLCMKSMDDMSILHHLTRPFESNPCQQPTP